MGKSIRGHLLRKSWQMGLLDVWTMWELLKSAKNKFSGDLEVFFYALTHGFSGGETNFVAICLKFTMGALELCN